MHGLPYKVPASSDVLMGKTKHTK